MASVPKLLLLVLCSCHTLFAYAGGDRSYKVVSIDSFKSGSVCSEPEGLIVSATSRSTGVMTVPLHHRHGPCSPLPSKEVPTLEEILWRDHLRAAYIQRKFSASGGDSNGGAGVLKLLDSDVTVPTTMGASFSTYQYVITVGLGTPAVTRTMLIDTGSDVSWVRCKPCSQCHSQVEPLFDPSSSSTYSPLSCSSAACTQLNQDKAGNGCSNSQCQYIVKYIDGDNATGTYSSDTLALGSNTITNFQFGCSHLESAGVFERTAGLLGLGGGPESLLSQTAGRFGTAFSYCLPPTASSSGFLTLGARTGDSSGFVKTPMLKSTPITTYYGLRLEAIRVGGRQLNISSSVFSAGAVMDSGAVLTRLQRTAYTALSAAFKDEMKKMKYQPGRRWAPSTRASTSKGIPASAYPPSRWSSRGAPSSTSTLGGSL